MCPRRAAESGPSSASDQRRLAPRKSHQSRGTAFGAIESGQIGRPAHHHLLPHGIRVPTLGRRTPKRSRFNPACSEPPRGFGGLTLDDLQLQRISIQPLRSGFLRSKRWRCASGVDLINRLRRAGVGFGLAAERTSDLSVRRVAITSINCPKLRLFGDGLWDQLLSLWSVCSRNAGCRQSFFEADLQHLSCYFG